MNKTAWIVLVIVLVVIAAGFAYAHEMSVHSAAPAEEGAMMDDHMMGTSSDMMASSSDHTMMASTSAGMMTH